MPEEAMVFLSFVAMAGVFGLLFPVVRALSDRLRGRERAEALAGTAVRALREEVLAELQQVRREVADLSERVDFAERLLARQRDAPQLGPGA